jgi:WD40 repeat protein/serine/threonine protein kinase
VSGERPSHPDSPSPAQAIEVNRICDRFEAAWKAGRRPQIEEYLGDRTSPSSPAVLLELVKLEMDLRRGRGEQPAPSEYRARFGDQTALIDAIFAPSLPVECPGPSPQGDESRSDPGRNLLLGVLALQNGFIDRDALLGAFNAWVGDKSRPLGQILLERGALREPRCALLEALVEEHLGRHGRDAERSLVALGLVGTAHSFLGGIPDTDLRASLSRLADLPTVDGPHKATLDAPTPSALPGLRFRLLRSHAKGGLGEVFVARDEEVHREVALKVILPEYADDPAGRARFLFEAEVTGNLEHPGVVPVYGLGRYPDGRPFYAMRLVRGENFKDAIARYHAGRGAGPDPGARSLELRNLLRRFLDVCNAIDYAHTRGVLHRDVKPGNVMVGKHGETMVIDWGLAKAAGREDGVARSEDGTLRPESGSDSGETAPGSLLGTPAYMSPEQAAGRLDRLGAVSDVYSLGATLYHLLTGRPPFAGNAAEVVPQVVEGTFTPPRQVNRAVPAGLEAVCLKAMAREPGGRYPSAKALANDVERWLADEPVLARRESAPQRVARWARRHRPLVLSLASVGATVAVASVVLLLVTQAWQIEQVQRHEASRAAAWLAFDHALDQCERGEVGRGMLGLVRSLAQAESAGDQDLQRVIRLNLDGWRTQSTALVALLPHWSQVTAVAFSPDGKTVLTGSRDTTARLWDVETGAPIGQPLQVESPEVQSPILAVAFSPDSRTAATAEANGNVRLWDGRIGGPSPFQTLKHPRSVLALAFSPDGKTLLTGCADGAARLWNPADGRQVGHDMRRQKTVSVLAFSPDGRTIATGSEDGTAVLWNASSQEPVGDPLRHEGEVRDLAFDPRLEGHRLLTGSYDQTARLWDVATGRALGPPLEHGHMVTTVAFSPDGRTVATGGGPNAVVRLWDVETGRQVGAPMVHGGWVFDVTFSPDGKTVLTGCGDTLARLWDVETCRQVGGPLYQEAIVLAVAFSPDGSTVVTAGDDKGARLWRLTTPWRSETPLQTAGRPYTMKFSADEKACLTGNVDHTAQSWEIEKGRPVGPPMPLNSLPFAAEFTPDGKSAVTITEKHVQVWDLSAGQPTWEIPQGTGHQAICVAISPDGAVLAAGGVDPGGAGEVRLWDMGKRKHISSAPAHSGKMVMVATFSPDGTQLLTGGQDAQARLWDAATLRLLGPPLGHGGWVRAVAFRPDGLVAVTGCNDGTARLWDLSNGRPIGPPLDHKGDVVAVAFSPDGKTVLTGAADGVARLWDAATGRPIGPGLTHRDCVRAVGFAPDGRTVLTGGFDRLIRRWDVPTPATGRVKELDHQVRRATGITSSYLSAE